MYLVTSIGPAEEVVYFKVNRPPGSMASDTIVPQKIWLELEDWKTIHDWPLKGAKP